MSTNINKEKTLSQAIGEYKDTELHAFIFVGATVITNLIASFALENNLDLKGILAGYAFVLSVDLWLAGLLTFQRNAVMRIENSQK